MKILSTFDKKIVISLLGVVCLLGIVTLTIKSYSKQGQIGDSVELAEINRQIENTQDTSMRVVGNEDCPLKITGVRVKEIEGNQFSRLTGKATRLQRITSVPEVDLINTSPYPITGYVLLIRDPKTKHGRTLVSSRVLIPPGAKEFVKKQHFIKPDKSKEFPTQIDRFWIEFAQNEDLYVTVGHVTFANGTTWLIQKGGEVK